MLFTPIIVALTALLPGLVSAGPIEKRYTNALIRSYRTNTCLTLQGGVQIVDGSLLRVGDCATATRWNINPGSGSVIVSGTNFALDAGSNPSNNIPAKVWTSYPGLTQQTWYLTGDNRIAITGGNQCLDQGDAGPQTYQCTTGNTNQIWLVEGAPPPPVSSSSAGPSSSVAPPASSVVSSSSSSPSPSGPVGPYSQIKFTRDQTLCATVQGTPANGTPVNLQNCFVKTAADSGPQRFYTFNNGAIQLVGTNYCLDAGTNPSNGVQMKLWQCYFGLAQQTWNFNGQLIQTANNQCLDVEAATNQKLQTWACSAPDVQQQFTVV